MSNKFKQRPRAASLQRGVSLLINGIAAAEGAQVVIESLYDQVSRDPCNNDNYCRLKDWIKAARRHRDEQANTVLADKKSVLPDNEN